MRGGRILLREPTNHYGCACEDLTFLVSEALAALSRAVDAAITAIGEAVAESENPEDHEEAEEALQALFNIAVSSFLGTQMVMTPGRSLKDFLRAGQA